MGSEERGDASVFAVGARRLHAELRVLTKATRWIQRGIARHGLVEGVDYVEATASETGRALFDARLTEDAATRMAEGRRRPARGGVVGPAGAATWPDDGGSPRSDQAGGLADATGFPAVREGVVGGRACLVVDAGELHETLGARTERASWVRRRLAQLELEEGADYERDAGGAGRPEVFARSGENPVGRPGDRTVFTLDAAKHVAMAEKTPAGRAVRRYFIGCERRLQETAAAEAAAETASLRDEVERLGRRRPTRDGAAGRPARAAASADGRPSLSDLLVTLASLPGATAAFVERVIDSVQGGGGAAGAPAPRAAEAAADGAGEATGEPGVEPGVEPRPTRTGPPSASATPLAANAGADGRPSHLHRTSVGVVVDMRLGINRSATADWLAVLSTLGFPPRDKSSLKIWRRRTGRGNGPGTPGGDGEGARSQGITDGERATAVAAFDAVRRERRVATLAHREAERTALVRDATAAAWARVRGELN